MKLILIILIAISFASCVTQKEIVYVERYIPVSVSAKNAPTEYNRYNASLQEADSVFNTIYK